MKTFITALTLAALVATSAMAKTIKTNDDQDTVKCGTTVLKDPDANIRSDFRRDCALNHRARD
jgi:hypothetical protein